MTMEMQAPQGHTMVTAAPLVFSDEQRQMIRETFANGANDSEFAVLMEVAKTRRLNPLMRQIHFVKRWTPRGDVWSVQVSIDGLRAIAERTGLYAGQDEPEFTEEEDGSLKCCKVRVYRKDWPRAAVGVAYFAEYVQTTRDKQTGKVRPNEMWGRMPHTMLAKCAEALALRKAFPEDMGGLYTGDEMGQAENDRPEPADVKHERQPSREQPRQMPAEVPAEGEVFQGEVVDPVEDDLPATARELIESINHCTLPGEVADRWKGGAAERKAWSRDVTTKVWTAAVKRVAALQGVTEAQAKVWLKKAVEGPQGPNGGRKPTAPGEAASARGEGTEGTAANDSGPVNTVRVVSEVALSIIDTHRNNLWGFRGALKKHREELLPGDVPELAKVLAKLDVDSVTGWHLTEEAAERDVCKRTGLVWRRVA